MRTLPEARVSLHLGDCLTPKRINPTQRRAFVAVDLVQPREQGAAIRHRYEPCPVWARELRTTIHALCTLVSLELHYIAPPEGIRRQVPCAPLLVSQKPDIAGVNPDLGQ